MYSLLGHEYSDDYIKSSCLDIGFLSCLLDTCWSLDRKRDDMIQAAIHDMTELASLNSCLLAIRGSKRLSKR
jgi:hypothetical protein